MVIVASVVSVFVFCSSARTQNKQYWRVETKDFYTGKGWKISENPKKISFKYDTSEEASTDTNPAG
jgi:hypothetical protein